MRNFLLRTIQNKKTLPFGNRFIQLRHLLSLLENYPRDAHQLTASILNPSDRQNFKSVERMCDEKVINMLKTEIIGSEATVLFLEIIRDVIDSYR